MYMWHQCVEIFQKSLIIIDHKKSPHTDALYAYLYSKAQKQMAR